MKMTLILTPLGMVNIMTIPVSTVIREVIITVMTVISPTRGIHGTVRDIDTCHVII